SNGRFGHPEQHRAISVREAALLQTFPLDYIFIGSMLSKAKQIGNAVPPKMAESIGHVFMNI
ncbi:DNA cytosine methyltransferase, partial [Escherichia coli]